MAVVTCEIEANPTNLTFIWKFKNTSGITSLLAEHFTTEGTRSLAKFTPLTELDYGSLFCWARNELGMQQEACVYHIIPAGIVNKNRSREFSRRRINAKTECTHVGMKRVKEDNIKHVYVVQPVV